LNWTHLLRRNTPLWVLILAAPVWAECADSSLELTASSGWVQSRWTELDAQGQALVRETGTLQATSVWSTWRCQKWASGIGFEQHAGERRYEGITSTGLAALSNSGIRKQRFLAEISYLVSAGLHLSTRFEGEQLHREIASTSLAAGYPETFRHQRVLIGAQWQPESWDQKLAVSAYAGQSLRSRMQLTLPGKDSAELPLGPERTLLISASWEKALSPQWSVRALTALRRTAMGKGDEVVITRFGLPNAVAHQPETRQTERSLSLQVTRQF